MGSHSIDKVKDKQCDVKRNIDTKKSEVNLNNANNHLWILEPKFKILIWMMK